MGLLDDLKAQVGDLATNAQGNLPAGSDTMISRVISAVNDPAHGGLQGLVQAFHDKGLGAIVTSWVGTSANLPISADQVTHALGADRLGQIAQSAGIPAGAVASQLSTLLPTVVDKLTPNGVVPEGSTLATGISMLQAVLGGHQAAPPA